MDGLNNSKPQLNTSTSISRIDNMNETNTAFERTVTQNDSVENKINSKPNRIIQAFKNFSLRCCCTSIKNCFLNLGSCFSRKPKDDDSLENSENAQNSMPIKSKDGESGIIADYVPVQDEILPEVSKRNISNENLDRIDDWIDKSEKEVKKSAETELSATENRRKG